MKTVVLLVIILGTLLVLLALTIMDSGEGDAVVLVAGLTYGIWLALRSSLARR